MPARTITCQCRKGRDVDDRTFRRWARSSAVEHCLDMAGVTGSIPVAPTIAHHNPLSEFLLPLLPRLRACRVLRPAHPRRRRRLQSRRDAAAGRRGRQGPHGHHGLSRARDCRPTPSRICCCRTPCSTRSRASIAKVVAASNKLFPVLIVGAPLRLAGRLYNTAIVIHRGAILGVVPKTYLPNYREFYEKRHFVSGANIVEQHDQARRPARRRSAPTCCSARPASCPSPSMSRSARTSGCRCRRRAMRRSRARRCWSTCRPATSPSARPRRGACCAAASRRARIAAYAYSASGPGESTTDLAWDGHAAIYECGDQLAETTRFEKDSTIVTADVDLGRIRQERLRNNGFADCAHDRGRQGPALPQGRLRARRAARQRGARARRRALPLRAVRSRQAARQLLRGLQHPDPGPGAAPAVEPHRAGDHRRVGRPRFDAGADRHLPGDGPARPAAQERASPTRCRASAPPTRPTRTPGG